MGAKVEVGIVDPNRMSEVEGHALDPLPVARDEVEALANRVLDSLRAATTRNLGLAFEDVDGADVQWRLRSLRIEKPGVASTEWFEKWRLAGHARIVGAEGSE